MLPSWLGRANVSFHRGYLFALGTWSIVKNQAIYEAKLEIARMTEHTGLKIGDPELKRDREIPSSVDLSLIRGNPLDAGFDVYNGDFWPVRFTKESTANEKSSTR